MLDSAEARQEETAKPRAYRTIVLAADGSVLSTKKLLPEIVSDDGAIAVARAMTFAHAVELWDGLRFIEHFEASSPTAS